MNQPELFNSNSPLPEDSESIDQIATTLGIDGRSYYTPVADFADHWDVLARAETQYGVHMVKIIRIETHSEGF